MRTSACTRPSKLRLLVDARKQMSFRKFFLLNTDQLSLEAHALSFAYVDFLISAYGGAKMRDLIRIATERGRAQRPEIKLGICGEHGGDPASIGFCEEVGLDYVSASPYRVPIARLAAAQAAIRSAASDGDRSA